MFDIIFFVNLLCPAKNKLGSEENPERAVRDEGRDSYREGMLPEAHAHAGRDTAAHEYSKLHGTSAAKRLYCRFTLPAVTGEWMPFIKTTGS